MKNSSNKSIMENYSSTKLIIVFLTIIYEIIVDMIKLFRITDISNILTEEWAEILDIKFNWNLNVAKRCWRI